ncbi:MAG: helical backbone metal receptor [Bacteroidota bacterium]
MEKSWMGITVLWMCCVLGCASSARKSAAADAPLISQTITDHTGRELRLPNLPKRIVSLAPNITEMVFAVGGGDKLIARSQACDYPEAAAKKTEVPTWPNLDLEAIAQTESDLIITTDMIFTPDDLAQIERLGIPIYLQHYGTMADIFTGMKDIGQLVGEEAQSNRVADSLETLVNLVLDSTENQIKYRTLMLISGNPLKVVGGSGFLHEMIEKAGGKNVYAARKEAFVETTVEEILRSEPEFLILPSKDDQVYAELLAAYPALYNTPADVYKQVHIIDPDLVYRPGPRMIEGLLTLTHILHTNLNPEIFLHAQP